MMRGFETRRWLSVAAMAGGLLVLPGACSVINSPSEPSSGAGGGPECIVPQDCGVSTDCEVFTCNGGACVRTLTKVQTPCQGGVCDGKGACVAPACTDMTKNGKESDVDCGGGECPACTDTKGCAQPTDCASLFCSGMKCAPCAAESDCAAAPDTFCASGVCSPKHKNGEPCTLATECSSGVCAEGICCNSDCPSGACGSCKVMGKEGTCTPVAAAGAPLPGTACEAGLTCDGKHNACQKCTSDVECATGHCADGFCCNTACNNGCERCDLPNAQGTCTLAPGGTLGKGCGNFVCNGASAACVAGCSGEKNCAPGTNCIFSSCVTPSLGGACTTSAQCESFACLGMFPNGMCVAPSCSDGTQNLYESDIDCGGSSCAKCLNGKKCSRNTDCATGFCSDGVCCNSACDGACNACGTGTCIFTPNAPCSDGWACTPVGTCNMSVCATPKADVGALVYLEEDFSDNTAGWQLDTDWQLGPAKESPVYQTSLGAQAHLQFGDPGFDHTASTDNRLAGVLIGGNPDPLSVHEFYWLTSPVLDTSHAPTLSLEFWRWLTSDYEPFMGNRVEAFDGAAWQVVWEQPLESAFLLDRAWTYQSFDVSAYKNAKFQVRFGYRLQKLGKGTAISVGQWNLDDVRIATAPCGAGQ